MSARGALLAVAVAILWPALAQAQAADPVDIAQARRLTVAQTSRIGGTDAREPYTFSRISHATILPSGEVALVDAGSREVRVFGRDGAYRRRFGREGQGPGEFSFIEGLVALRDGRILVFDGSRRQVSIFTDQGEHLSSHRVGSSGWLVGAFPDGSIVLRSAGSAASMMSRRPGAFRDSITFSIVAPPYSAAGTSAAVLEGPDQFLRVMGNARNVSSKLFEPSVVAAVAREDLIVASTGIPTLRRRGVAAESKPDWQLLPRRRPVLAAQVRVERERRLREFEQTSARPAAAPPGFAGPPPETQRLRREAIENLETYATFPEFRSIMAGADGALWLEDYPLPGATRVRWYRLENGVATAWIELDPEARILAVANDLLVQVVRDSFGVETAVILRVQ